MKKKFWIVLTLCLFQVAIAQPPIPNPPNCEANVPYFQLDLTGAPDSLYLTPPGVVRTDQCCGNPGPERFVYFEVILDTGTAMVEVGLWDGAPSGKYQVDCGPEIDGHHPTCITGVGPHHIVYNKPGNNPNQYYFRAIPKPIFPKDDSIRIGCTIPNLEVLGLNTSSITWNSIYPDAYGTYNNYLSHAASSNTTSYTPATDAPFYIDYQICGTPLATECGYVYTCDTMRIYNYDSLWVTVTPDPAYYCEDGPGVTLYSTVTGGLAPFEYIWINADTLGTADTVVTTEGGTHTLEVKDIFYHPLYCSSVTIPVSVIASEQPIIDVEGNKTVCPESPSTLITAEIQYANGLIWSGGNGDYSPSDTSLAIIYTPTQEEIEIGAVTLYATTTGIGGGCSSAIDSITISFPDSIRIILNDTMVLCHNDWGTLNPQVTGGLGSYGFVWNNGSGNPEFNGPAGNYCLSVYDSIGCYATACANIISPAILNASISSTDVSNNLLGTDDGTATVVPVGGTAPYTYLWNNGQTNATAIQLEYGIYTVTVTDNNGCTYVTGVVVNKPNCSGFQVGVHTSSVTCYNSSTGSAYAYLIDTTFVIESFTWSSPISSTSDTAYNLYAGSYLLTAIDTNGCADVVAFLITEPDPFYNTMNATNTTTVDGNNGTATANPVGGTMPYSYLWNTGDTTSAINNLYPGTYTITITDANGCIIIDSIIVNNYLCSDYVIAGFSTPVLCNGDTNGVASAQVLIGNAPYQYTWNTGETTSSISNLSAGVYTVSIVDSLQCSSFISITVLEPDVLSASLAPTPPLCHNTSDGTIELVVTGGTSPYHYLWNNGYIIEDRYNLSGGNYTVTITDENGCSTQTNTSFTAPTQLEIEFTQQDLTCYNDSSGAIDITVSGGVTPYAYEWSNGATSQDLTGLSSGLFLVTVTDQNGCIINGPVGSFYINQPSDLKLSTYTVDCPIPGDTLAYVSVTPEGGNENGYFISFDNGITYQNENDFDAYLPTGETYIIVVKDSSECTSSIPDTITIIPYIFISSVDYNPCFDEGENTTLVTINGEGGLGSYQASFNNGMSYNSWGDLTEVLVADSTYYIIIRDSLLCQSDTFTIHLYDTLSVNYTLSNYNGENVSCYNANDGWIDVSPNGGLAPYQFSWNNSDTSSTADSLMAGIYQLIVTDAQGCRDTTHYTLTQPDILVIDSITPILYAGGYNISCNGYSDGAVQVYAQGGTLNYSYIWSNGNTTQSISNLSAGTYSVTITDLNGCSTSSQTTLNQPQSLQLSITAHQYAGNYQISCYGENDGSINLSVTGGTPGYLYDWSNDSTSQDLNNLFQGTYSVIVTDQNECTADTLITLTQPNELIIDTLIRSLYNGGYNISCHGLQNGSINMQYSGGTPSYSILWSTGSTIEDINNIGAGVYSVSITDANGCSAHASTSLTQPPSLVVDSLISSSFAGGYQISCFGYNDGQLNLTVSGGTPGYNYQWSNGANTQDISSLTAGTYNVTITDQNNCTTSSQSSLTQPQLLDLSYTTSQYNGNYQISCYGENDGNINVSVTGGTSSYQYEWSNGSTTQDINNIQAGSYSLVVSDANGCNDSISVTLLQPNELMIDTLIRSMYNGGYNISCYGLNNGSINMQYSGGTANYSILWSTGSTIEDINNIGAGIYTVSITDANGCSAQASTSLTQPPSLVVDSLISSSFAGGYQISCYGATDGSLNLTISGGTPGYNYQWSNGGNTQDISSITAGTYTITVTDQNNCTTSSVSTLTQPQALNLSYTTSQYNGNYQISCYGENDGFINVSVTGGTPSYQYEWSNDATSQDINNLQAGIYTLVVSDANGCNDSISATLLQPDELVIDTLIPSLYLGGVNISCYGLANGNIEVIYSGGTPQYTILWSNGHSTDYTENLEAGNYSVTISDANGCSASSSIILTEPEELNIDSMITSLYQGGYNISCNNSEDGFIQPVVSGGVSPFNYLWNNGFNSAVLEGIAAGNYTVTITDLNSCSTSGSIELTQPRPFAIRSHITNVLCNGANDGSIELAVSGGQPDYQYDWTNGSTEQDIYLLGPGLYAVNITDANGCDTTLTFNLTEYDPIIINADVTNIDCYGDDNGSIEVTISGGNDVYTISWSNGNTQEDLDSLTGGLYIITVKDANNCIQTDTFEIIEPQPLQLELSSPIYYNGHNILIPGGNNGYINAIVNGGTTPFDFNWSNGATTEDLAFVTAGTYSVIVTDVNGCSTIDSITLTQPMILEMPNAYSPNGDGFNDFFIVHGIESYPNNVFTVINRWGNEVYTKEDYANEWNGNNNNGGQVPDGTYFVILDINEGEIILKGYVDLRRSK